MMMIIKQKLNNQNVKEYLWSHVEQINPSFQKQFWMMNEWMPHEKKASFIHNINNQ